MLDGFNATCYGLTMSQYQANQTQEKLLCKLQNTVTHPSYIYGWGPNFRKIL